ncbi:DNA-protecting protein DprA [Paenibacillus marchantiae]|uniref:DNA-processing protein DprA n=1 Tax=Paenibacillus marchantiae TaxID=3026433 RepID=UPI00237A3A69|nr:DNA-processing protein DprA [Paenibacillus marchantiae]WDQ32170.1 DNA-protecting protein DprA [Paenibacillus marchantiae]
MLDVVQLLALLNLKGVGRGTVASILSLIESHPSTKKELHDYLSSIHKEISRFQKPEFLALENAFDQAERIVDYSNKYGIKIFGINDHKFPKRLKIIPDRPVVLFVKGNEEVLHDELSVAIIGTRSPSEYGEICAKRFAGYFTKKGLSVVSGLALGIDTAGHIGCLEENGRTVAVLAQGLDTPIYPAKNKELARRILDNNGCLISEYSPTVRARSNFFVERDRLQAGLSAAVVVIETDIKGGTMHTVKFCLSQQKPLGVLSHPQKFIINNPKSNGNQYLINEEKAVPLFSIEDMEDFIGSMEGLSELREESVIKRNKLKKKDIVQTELEF